jgi:hypothetical protein
MYKVVEVFKLYEGDLAEEIERTCNRLDAQGYEIVSVQHWQVYEDEMDTPDGRTVEVKIPETALVVSKKMPT